MEDIQEIEFFGTSQNAAESKLAVWLRKQQHLKLLGKSVRHQGWSFEDSQHQWSVKLYFAIESE
jgi:hypothetical protein